VAVADPVLPSLVATIELVPAASALTTPAALTVATVVLLDDHAIERPPSTLLFASFNVATAWEVPPTGMVAEGRLTAIELTGTSETTRLADPLWPSLVATIVVEPGATAETRPAEDTAMEEALLADQLTARSVRIFPSASLTTAVACSVWPTKRLEDGSETLTDATAGGRPEPFSEPEHERRKKQKEKMLARWRAIRTLVISVPYLSGLREAVERDDVRKNGTSASIS
jgi:hypothetical protein